nr:MAG TPA: hypothetical protein [Caudoviricetes sp.]DAU59390.1 MAG TPA: hypothetical protein [Crassvirales sp.]
MKNNLYANFTKVLVSTNSASYSVISPGITLPPNKLTILLFT